MLKGHTCMHMCTLYRPFLRDRGLASFPHYFRFVSVPNGRLSWFRNYTELQSQYRLVKHYMMTATDELHGKDICEGLSGKGRSQHGYDKFWTIGHDAQFQKKWKNNIQSAYLRFIWKTAIETVCMHVL